jgi:hypothetical protein
MISKEIYIVRSQLELVSKDPEQFTINYYDDNRMAMKKMDGPFTKAELHAKFPDGKAELERAIAAAREA